MAAVPGGTRAQRSSSTLRLRDTDNSISASDCFETLVLRLYRARSTSRSLRASRSISPARPCFAKQGRASYSAAPPARRAPFLRRFMAADYMTSPRHLQKSRKLSPGCVFPRLPPAWSTASLVAFLDVPEMSAAISFSVMVSQTQPAACSTEGVSSVHRWV